MRKISLALPPSSGRKWASASFLGYFHHIGFHFAKFRRGGVPLASFFRPVAELALLDDALRIHCCAGKVGNTSLRFDFQIFNETKKRLTAKGEITVVIADRKTFQKMRVPDHFRQALEEDQQ